MDFDLDQRTARLSVGEFSEFILGPRDSVGGPSGLWRAQLGTHWHQQLRLQTSSALTTATFEVPIEGRIFHRGWTLSLAGRIDQVLPASHALVLREIKTVTREIPCDENELRAAYPAYFLQLAAYLALARLDPAPFRHQLPVTDSHLPPFVAELQFVEAASGLAQTVAFTRTDESSFQAQLERVVQFLDLRLRARERLRHLRFRPPFARLRPGQETAQADLTTALARNPLVFFEAPTGFGKTGVLLECALNHLRGGRYDRLVYLTGKATGQLQVMRSLSSMAVPAASGDAAVGNAGPPVTAWVVRPKREHCIHTVYHCSRDVCPYLSDLESRWARSGLARFYLLENEARDLPTLRAAGRDASICPYEITRTALPFNDVWIGDFNYVFSPSVRGLFYEQPGFDPARTLLVVDEAHNLPSRVADAYSHAFAAVSAQAVQSALQHIRSSGQLTTAWSHWAHFLDQRTATDALSLSDEEDARHLLDTLARLIATSPVDTTELGPDVTEAIWQIPSVIDQLNTLDLPRLWWSPRAGELAIACLDPARAIGPVLRSFGGVILASATLAPMENFSAACGLDEVPAFKPEPAIAPPDRLGTLTKRDTRRLYAQLSSGADLLKVEEARDSAVPAVVRASTPWRDHAYNVAVDLRVDTSFQQRSRHATTTAATLAALCAAARTTVPADAGTEALPSPAVAAFFSSYAYAESIQRELAAVAPHLRLALQPRLPDLAAQTAWVESSLASADALFLVLGSSFAEGIDLLGGRVSHSMVIGPALPEVNAIQRSKLGTFSHLGREGAFRRVYQIPGIQKVNQALGRLVRAPGQRAKVLLHCRRFGEPAYADLLAPEYRSALVIDSETELAAWLESLS